MSNDPLIAQRGIVEKYGGTSLASAALDRKAVEHVVETMKTQVSPDGITVLVVSGHGRTDDTVEGKKATDHAYDIVKGIVDKNVAWSRLEEIITKNIKEHGYDGLIDDLLTDAHDALKKLYDSRERVLITSLPERAKLRVIYKIARELIGDECVMLDYDQNGIVGQEVKGNIDIPIDHNKTLLSIEAISKRTALKGKLVVISGFTGKKNGTEELITLQRGTGDDTAVYFASGMEANEIRIYSDKPGLTRVDPRIIPTAESIAGLTYLEAETFAGLGAGIINYGAIRPARERKIPIKVLSSFDQNKPGTTISIDIKPSNEYFGIKAIACVSGYTIGVVYDMRMDQIGVAAKVANIFAQNEIDIAGQTDGGSNITYAFKPNGHLDNLTKALSDAGHRIDISHGFAKIAIIGEGMMNSQMIGEEAEEIFYRTLRINNIVKAMHTGGRNDIMRTAFIDQDHAAVAIKKIYGAFGFK